MQIVRRIVKVGRLPQSGGSWYFPHSGDWSYLFSSALLQRGQRICNFLGTLFRFVRPLLWTVGRAGCKIITDIAKNNSPDVRAEDIISKHVGDAVTESTHRLISKFLWPGPETCHTGDDDEGRVGKKPKKTPAKCAQVIKTDNFS